jgi:hypothetical protein
MKRLFSLLLLLLCSLTMCGTAGAQQTWRLTDDAYSDSLPQITRDNSGRVWVAWLSNESGNYDVYCSRYSGATWGTVFSIQVDNVDQNNCAITNDSASNRIWVAWDSSGLIGTRFSEGLTWYNSMIVDSTHALTQAYGFSKFCMASDKHGKVYFAWSSDSLYVGVNGYLKCTANDTFSGTETVYQSNGYDPWIIDDYLITDFAFTSNLNPVVSAKYLWQGLAASWGTGMVFRYFKPDSGWITQSYGGWGWSMGQNYGSYTTHGSITCDRSDHLLVVCVNGQYSTGDTLYCKKFNSDSIQFDADFQITRNIPFQSASITKFGRPTLAWSDSHSVFLNTYYDTIWSHPPVRISDTSLHNCINPDIVAENDSTVWVCYQNDGDIYVTRTTVPLGVTGSANNGERRPRTISLKAWPNPASNVIHFLYNLPNTRNSSVSIYDITGRLVKNIEVKDNQIHWNCADNAGRRVASGVYFARLRSDGLETIRKISVIR